MLSLYGGVGLGIHDAWFDQLDIDGSPYDYANATASTEEATISAIENLRDNGMRLMLFMMIISLMTSKCHLLRQSVQN